MVRSVVTSCAQTGISAKGNVCGVSPDIKAEAPPEARDTQPGTQPTYNQLSQYPTHLQSTVVILPAVKLCGQTNKDRVRAAQLEIGK